MEEKEREEEEKRLKHQTQLSIRQTHCRFATNHKREEDYLLLE